MAPSSIKTDPKDRQEKSIAKQSTNDSPGAERSGSAGAPALAEQSSEPRGAQYTTQQVSLLAYSFWEERLRNNIAGSAEDDWFRAERHLAE